MLAHKNKSVWVFVNGNLVKVTECKVQDYDNKSEDTNNDIIDKDKENVVKPDVGQVSIDNKQDSDVVMQKEFEISKIDRDKFRFTGLDIERMKNGNININMEEYAKALKVIPIFRDNKNDSRLTTKELKIFRSYVGKFMWLSENVRPDLSFTVLDLSKKTKEATLGDMKKINYILKRIGERITL